MLCKPNPRTAPSVCFVTVCLLLCLLTSQWTLSQLLFWSVVCTQAHTCTQMEMTGQVPSGISYLFHVMVNKARTVYWIIFNYRHEISSWIYSIIISLCTITAFRAVRHVPNIKTADGERSYLMPQIQAHIGFFWVCSCLEISISVRQTEREVIQSMLNQ